MQEKQGVLGMIRVLFVCHGNIFLKSTGPHKHWAREEWRPVLGQF